MRLKGFRYLGIVAIALTLAGPASRAAADCSQTHVPVRIHGDRAMVEVAIDEHEAHMVLDTGASESLLMSDAPARLGLAMDGGHPAEQRMSYGKAFDVRFARVRRIGFAGAVTEVDDLAVAAGSEEGVDGFFTDGRLLRADFDLAHGRVDLVCDGAPPPDWTRRPGVSVVTLETASRLFGTAFINDRPVRVLFDTGAPGSSMTLAAANRTGVTVSGAPATNASGIGMTQPLRAWRANLARLRIGEDLTTDVPLTVIDKPNASADMIAGFDFFLRHRVWVDLAHNRLVFRAAD